MFQKNKIPLMAAMVLSLIQIPSMASLTIVPNSGATQAGNLITNGSFENTAGGGPTGIGPGNDRIWVTGSTQNFTSFAVPTGWTSSGGTNSYGIWGNDVSSPPYTLRGSDVLPDGTYGIYFGNGGPATINKPPTFNMTTGEVTFASSPTVTPPPGFTSPVVLSQTIPTVANPAPQYVMSFWASGESSGTSLDNNTGVQLGIFGLQMTNVLSGDPILYFAVPSSSQNALGASFVYDFQFTPINPLLNVDVNFINWGHFDLSSWGRSITTELVIDDVRVNAIVPEPTMVGLLMMSSVVLMSRRKRV